MTPQTEAVLTLAQWLSPSFPIGAFSYSHGLEWGVHEGTVSDAESLKDWLADIIEHGAGRNDVILLRAAYVADDTAEIDALACALAPSKERLLETTAQGAAFAKVIADVWGHDVRAHALPVAVGEAARAEVLPVALTAQTYLHGFVAALVSAGLRLGVAGQTDGQRILRDLKPLCQEVASRETSLDDLGSSSFAADIASMKHETLNSRMFRT